MALVYWAGAKLQIPPRREPLASAESSGRMRRPGGRQMGRATMVRSFVKNLRRCAEEAARFRRSREGTTAVEFALIAPAFLATLIAVLQTCVFVFAQQTLQTAAMQAG